jgi:carbonic anhydrase/SulP family sulfate permease
MSSPTSHYKNVSRDLVSGLVVFFIALPLCLGIALASNAPLFSGILAGIIGGILVGFISGSSTSVSGPAAGLTAVVAAQINHLGSFETFLAAVALAGVIQIILSIAQLGFIAAFFPSNVIKGLLWAIGALLILKQIPHLFGHDADPIGNNTFIQADNQNTFTELVETFFDVHPGAALIGLISIAILVSWEKIKFLKNSFIPGPLVVILFGVLGYLFLQRFDENWALTVNHLVQVPEAKTLKDSLSFLTFPDFSKFYDSTLYIAAITIALVASLETLLNLEAVDKIDPMQRISPPNRELMAQGVGNLVAGLIGAIPVTSVIVRSSVNINSGAKTKVSTIWHGLLLLGSVLLIPTWLNKIPLSALAAILLVTGIKLASPQMVMQMWKEGKNQFLPFAVTVVAIIFTDLLIGVIIGLVTAIYFILRSNIRRPIKKIMEKHATGNEVLHIELPNQVSFFNRASLENTLKNVPYGKHVLIDANSTDYIDPDILDLITDFKNSQENGDRVSLVGFKDKYPQLEDRIQYVDFSNRETQAKITPEQVLEILQEGNSRFRNGIRITRDLDRQLNAAAEGQFPMAVVLSCIDSRTPVELVFDLSLGDVFSVRIAGNVVSRKILGSIEYGCAIAGAKVVLVMGHTSCGAIKAAVDFTCSDKSIGDVTGCNNLDFLIEEIQKSIEIDECKKYHVMNGNERQDFLDDVSYNNVVKTIQMIREESPTIDRLIKEGKIALVGAMYNISTAEVTFFQPLEASAGNSSSAENSEKEKSFKKFIKNIKNTLKSF